SAPAALGTFLMVSTSAPLLNALLMATVGVFVPVFDVIFAGLSSVVFLAFAKLSLESLRTRRFRLQRQIDSDVADVKGNFISLVSHNLNTPVAKMQGMLDLLNQLPIEPALKDAV